MTPIGIVKNAVTTMQRTIARRMPTANDASSTGSSDAAVMPGGGETSSANAPP